MTRGQETWFVRVGRRLHTVIPDFGGRSQPRISKAKPFTTDNISRSRVLFRGQRSMKPQTVRRNQLRYLPSRRQH
jgi:hypothetical protein